MSPKVRMPGVGDVDGALFNGILDGGREDDCSGWRWASLES